MRNWIRKGALKAFRVGRRVLIRREVLEEFVREMEAGRVM
ncbi:helix-turn-helix domain-containing protein [Thermus thermophilus]|nr:helix-turn-helix domain-containing protein [Thermus thermophilus]